MMPPQKGILNIFFQNWRFFLIRKCRMLNAEGGKQENLRWNRRNRGQQARACAPSQTLCAHALGCLQLLQGGAHVCVMHSERPPRILL